MEQAIVARKASRRRVKLRIGLSGPAGSGKTTAALLIAYGMTGDWGKIAVIDSENESAALYVDKRHDEHGLTVGEFIHVPLTAPFTPERYVKALAVALDAGAEVVIYDSATHEWDGKGGCLEIVDSLGGKYQDWAKVTPRHRSFIDSMLQCPAHTIMTMRSKQDYAMETDSKGKVKVTKLGMKEVQREGTEYELTLNFSIDIGHLAKASKDRTGLFMELPEFRIGPEVGRTLVAWNQSGAEPTPDYTVVKRRIMTEAERLKLDPRAADFKAKVAAMTGIGFEDRNLDAILAALQKSEAPKPPEAAPPQDGRSAGGPPPGYDAAAAERASQEIAAMAFGGDAPKAPAPPARRGKGTIVAEYSVKMKAASTLEELDAVHALVTLDKDVIADSRLDTILKEMEDSRIRELMGIASKAQNGPSQASETEDGSEDQKTGKGATAAKISGQEGAPVPTCESCGGSQETATGADCPSCVHAAA